jgi:lipopolysaccharide transport system permease protein
MPRAVVRIRPRGRGVDLGLGFLYSYRDLLFFLAWRDVKVRYSQTLLGALWAVLQPLAAAAVFVAVFSRLAAPSSVGPPYSAFALAGLVPWVYFANAVLAGANSIIASANIVTKVYFPRILIPAAAAMAGLLDLLLSGLVLAAFLWWRGVDLSLNFPRIIVALSALVAVALGLAFWAAALNVRYRDFRHALPFLVQLGLFATPVIYPVASLPAGYRALMSVVNPMTGVVENFRAGLFGTPIPVEVGGVWIAICILALLTGAAAFRRVEHGLADVI